MLRKTTPGVAEERDNVSQPHGGVVWFLAFRRSNVYRLSEGLLIKVETHSDFSARRRAAIVLSVAPGEIQLFGPFLPESNLPGLASLLNGEIERIDRAVEGILSPLKRRRISGPSATEVEEDARARGEPHDTAD